MMLLSLRHMFCIYPELEKLWYCDPLLSRPWHLLRHKGSQQRALPTQKSWSTVKLRSGICSGGASCACSCTDAAACHLLPVGPALPGQQSISASSAFSSLTTHFKACCVLPQGMSTGRHTSTRPEVVESPVLMLLAIGSASFHQSVSMVASFDVQ